MRPTWILAALAVLTAGPALAQGLIPPSRQYSTPAPERLDKSYGLPTFGTPGAAMPQQKAVAPKAQERPPAPFTGLPTFAKPDAEPSDTPDFFQRPSGLTSSETGVPNFFEETPDAGRPRVRTTHSGETPMFTTDEGSTTGDTSVSRTRTGETPDD
jgi:hypothetical protein